MENLSISQKYFLFAVAPQGKIQWINGEYIISCLVGAAVIDLMIDKSVEIDPKGKLYVTKTITKHTHLFPLFNVISNCGRIKFLVLLQNYQRGSRDFKELFDAIGTSLANSSFVAMKKKEGIFRKSVLFIPHSDALAGVTRNIRMALKNYENCPLDIVRLLFLLKKSCLLGTYFLKEEVGKIGEILNSVEENSEIDGIKNMLIYIDSLQFTPAADVVVMIDNI